MLMSTIGFAQAEASHWYFGSGAGLIFDVDTGTVSNTTDAAITISTNEGCSSISDFNGNLLFYTDGRNVWDKNHNIMPNANYNSNPNLGLMGDPSSTSSGLIVPKPGDPNQYYIFTVDEPHHQNAFAFPNQGPADEFGNPLTDYDSNGGVPDADDGFNNGFAYSLVDLTLNSGNGDVVSAEKNVQLVTYNPNEQDEESYKCSEKITAVEHSDKQSYWVLTHFIDNFYAFRVDASGVNTTPVVTNITPLIAFEGYRRNSIGYMKASPDGSKIAVCHRQNGNQPGGFSNNSGGVWLYDFDNSSGTLSNPVNLLPNSGPYGVEFSPDSSKLYVSGSNSVFQFDLNATDPASTNFMVFNGFNFIGALQLGPDGKIYVANTEDSQSLDVINDPDSAGVDSNYVPYQMQLAPGTFSNIGLPPFIQSFFLASIQLENSCVGQETEFNVNSTQTFDSIAWNFGDGIGTSNDNSPTYTFSNPGTYTVSAEITAGTEVVTFTEDIIISLSPTAFPTDDLFICDDNNDGISSFTFQESLDDIFNGQDPTVFSISFHSNLDDAEAHINEITLPYQNTNPTEEIFVRIENNNNTNCFDITSFTINVFDTPTANAVSTVEECDNLEDGNAANGQRELTLSDYNSDVLGVQDAALFSVSYHLSQVDANNKQNPITSPYYNTTPFSYVVFARIENNLNTDCYDTTEFTVNISATPTANTADDLFECDDNNDGVWLFDFIETQTQVLDNQNPSDFTISFHHLLEDAENNTNAIALPYQNTDRTEEIFVRIENNENSNCFETTSFNINVYDTPIPPPAGIEYIQCDYTNAGDLTEVFNLQSLNAEIANGQNVTITHHTSLEDAQDGINPITDPYSNTSQNQTIYALLTNNVYSGCTSIGTYNIIVNPLPNLITNVPLVQCDIDNIQDGISIYNLEEAAENIIVGDDPTNYTLSFHLTQEDLEGNINAIPDPTNFVNTSPLQTIYTRVENIATTCYSTSYFYLETIFNPIPEDARLIVCDNSEMNGNDYDGLGLFTLSDANAYILSLIVANPDNDISDANQLDIAYYVSENDALLETNQLPNEYISEVPNLQTVFLRIERGNDCFGINTMLLEVVPVPEFNDVPDDILCTDTPGIAEVVLTDYDPFVLGSQAASDIIISYHATQEDADLGLNPLTSPHTVNNEQTIFVREEIQNNDPDVTACYITNVNFTLTVEQNPEINIPNPVYVCDDDADGLQTFDLTGLDVEIIGTQTDMIVSYYTNQNDAENASNAIGNLFVNTIPNTQTLIFRIESLITGCYSTGNVELIVNPLPIIPPLEDFIRCDDNVENDNNTANDSVEFDLQTQNSSILNGLDSAIFEVRYYASESDAQQGINPLPLQFVNTTNPQIIYTRLENTTTDCFSIAPLVLKIDPLPSITLDEEYLLCVNTNGTEIIDPLIIYSNLSTTDYTFVWSNSNGEVLETGPNFEPIQGGIYTLEVFDTLLPTQCGSPAEIFTVIESSPPEVTAEVISEPFASTHIIESTATGQGNYEYSLDNGPWSNSGLFVGVTPGEHIINVRDANGCGTQNIPVFVFDYPKFFTPNQDGYNDTWNINAFANQPNAKIHIFDRYGKLLKQISPAGRGWDGIYNGEPMPSTDYWFTFEYTDVISGNKKELAGHFTLKR